MASVLNLLTSQMQLFTVIKNYSKIDQLKYLNKQTNNNKQNPVHTVCIYSHNGLIWQDIYAHNFKHTSSSTDLTRITHVLKVR